jgi:hypothetical protein
VQVADSSSTARWVQANPIPNWFLTPFSLTADPGGNMQLADTTSALSQINPASPGAPGGTTVTGVYLRLGRNDLSSGPSKRRVPVGQPMGTYTGTLGAFVDDLGDPTQDCPDDWDNQPDTTAKTAIGGSATIKVTVAESPLAQVADLQNNDTDRALESANVNNVAPYGPTNFGGSYQPTPVFSWIADPNIADATPAVAVQQNVSQLTADPPNAGDLLSVAFSQFKAGGSTNWDVWLQQAGRFSLPAGQTAQSNYFGFDWSAGSGGLAVESVPTAGQRNLHPSLCPLPGTDQAVLLWHNESDNAALLRRQNSLQLRLISGTAAGGVVTIADDAGGAGLVNKQVPRAFVDQVNGGPTVLWVGWQTGDGGRSHLGFNAITVPGYTDAITPLATGQSGGVTNYELHTPPGLTNVIDPWLLPSYRNETTNAVNPDQVNGDPRTGDLRLINGFYSAWSPLWQTQSIYWTRWRALVDPSESSKDNVNTWSDGLANSPMAENAIRLTPADSPGPITLTYPAGGATMTLDSLPGGRYPFARISSELLTTNAEHRVYGSTQCDWVMPPDKPTYSYCDPNNPGTRIIVPAAHRGFCDTAQPITDTNSAGAQVPLVALHIYPTASLTAPAPNLNATPAPALQSVGFVLGSGVWDPTAGEWVLPLDSTTAGGATLAALGVTTVRVAPGLGQVTFNKPLYKTGATNPIYVYADYRPCAWRMTTDIGVDSQPAAAFDWYERLVLVWRRATENGRGQLYYRTYSLGVPVMYPPVATNSVSVTDLSATPNTTSAYAFATGEQRDGMLNVPPTMAGHRLQLTYSYNYYSSGGTASATATNESTYVPGLGPERLVPMDGIGSESQPAIAPEFFLTGYPLSNTTYANILSTRFWLAWVSTRDLYKPGAAGGAPIKGTAATHIFYGALQPDFSPPAEAQ